MTLANPLLPWTGRKHRASTSDVMARDRTARHAPRQEWLNAIR